MRHFGYHCSVHDVGNYPYVDRLISALETAKTQGFTAAQIFLCSPQQYTLPSCTAPELIRFKEWKYQSGMKIYAHASYTLHTFAKPENVSRNNAVVRQHVWRAASLGLDGYVIHMGGTKWYEDGPDPMVKYYELAKTLCNTIGGEALHTTPLLLENCASGNQMSGHVSVIIDTILDLRSLYFNVGLCLDTCHAFAWGLEFQPDYLWISRLASVLKLIHLNNASQKVKFGSHLDRHDSLLNGVIPLKTFKWLLSKHPECPVILERDNMTDIMHDQVMLQVLDRHSDIPADLLQAVETACGTTDLKTRLNG